MPQIAIPDTARVVLRLVRGDEEIVNVFHVEDVSGLSSAQKLQVIDAIAGIYYFSAAGVAPNRGLRNYLDSSVTLFNGTYQDISTVPYEDPTEYIYSQAGTGASEMLPLSTALCVSYRTGISSPSARGRTYLGGFAEDANTEGSDGYPRPSTAFLQDVVDAYTDLKARLEGISVTLDLAVASYKEATSRQVTSVRVSNRWSSQRRRQESVPITATTAISF